jgi:prophage antirepressor-like protein
MALRVFEHGNVTLKSLRVNGVVWFRGADATASLEYPNTSRAMVNVDPDYKRTLGELANSTESVYLARNAQAEIWVNEYGLTQLALSLKTPKARRYQRWVFEEVLPAIHRTGTYSVSPEADVGDVVRMLADRVNGSVTVRAFPNTTKGAMFEADGLGRAVGYRTPELSVLYHAKQAGRESWCYQRDLDGGDSYRIFVTKEVVLRVLLRSYKPATKAFRNWAFKARLPERKALLA